MKYLPFLFCMLMLSASVHGQDGIEDRSEEEEQVDQAEVFPPTGAIELRRFDDERIESLRSEYRYDADLRREPSVWERFKEWLGLWFEKIFGPVAGTILTRELFYVLVFLIVVFAVVMLSKSSFQRVFHGKPRSMAEVAVSEEDIREMDIGQMIQEAERNGDLRRAIRFHYLLVLRKLVDEGKLSWHPHNTDEDYMDQIKNPILRSRFAHVVLVFQWVWYGNAEVAPAKYEDLRRPFIEFETQAA